MRNLENENLIVFVEGDEDRVVIEKAGYDTSLFSNQYTTAFSILKRLVEIREDEACYPGQGNARIIAFCGDRGAGKTSCMMSVRYAIEHSGEGEIKSYLAENGLTPANLDLLGFSNAVLRNAEEALAMLNSYNSILHFGIAESELHPSSGYPRELQKLAKRSSTESFKDFLPFSDSIFITSDDCSDFLLQLGEFLYKSFHLTAHFYAHPENEKDPKIL